MISIDVNPEVVEMALRNARRYKAKDVSFVVADARNLPFRDKVFNVCFSQGLLEHFGNRTIRDIILEASRVAGKMIFNVPSINYPKQDFGNERLLTPWHILVEIPSSVSDKR